MPWLSFLGGELDYQDKVAGTHPGAHPGRVRLCGGCTACLLPAHDGAGRRGRYHAGRSGAAHPPLPMVGSVATTALTAQLMEDVFDLWCLVVPDPATGAPSVARPNSRAFAD